MVLGEIDNLDVGSERDGLEEIEGEAPLTLYILIFLILARVESCKLV